MSLILGLSYGYHDSSAALLDGCNLILACEEERLTRIKHDNSFPINSIRFILAEAGIGVSDISKVVIYEDPILKLSRQVDSTIKSIFKFKFSICSHCLGFNFYRLYLPRRC